MVGASTNSQTTAQLSVLLVGHSGSIHFRRWVDALAQHPRVNLWVLDWAERSPNLSCPVLQWPYPFNQPHRWQRVWARGRNIQWLHQLVRTNRIDIVHVHWLANAYDFFWLPRSLPLIIHLWGSDLLHLPSASYKVKFYSMLALRRAQCILVPARHMKQFLCDQLRIPASKISIIRWGIDPALFRPRVDGSTGHDRCVLLSYRAWRPLYNIDIIIQAFAMAVRQEPKLHLIIKSPPYTTDAQPWIEQLIRQADISPTHITLAGPCRYYELPGWLHQADAVVSIPSSDGSPVSLLESMACGCLPIVSDIPGNREWIQDGYNGLIVPVRDVEATAQAMVTIARMPHQQKTLWRQRNYQIVQKEGLHSFWVARLVQLYHSIL